MRNISLGEAPLHGETCTGTLSYQVVVDMIRSGDGSVFCENYGVRVILDTGNFPRETVTVRGITPCRRSIEALMELMIRNTVTPVTAGDVIEDFLAVIG